MTEKEHLNNITPRLQHLIKKHTDGNITAFAKEIGVTPKTIHNQKNGKISTGLARKIALRYRYDEAYLLTGHTAFSKNEENIFELKKVIDISKELPEIEAVATIRNVLVYEKQLMQYEEFSTFIERIKSDSKATAYQEIKQLLNLLKSENPEGIAKIIEVFRK